ncbi:MAG: arylsulfatase [bacterium]
MASDRPNVLLFTTDQHRGDHLGIAGHPALRTPYVDAFARQGAYFPNAYTEISSTTGARRVLLAGQASYACGLVGYSTAEWFPEHTVASVLADAGYHCLNVGWRNLHPRRKLYGFHSVIPHDLSIENDDYLEWLRREIGPYEGERGHGVGCNDWTARPWHLDERTHPTAWTTEVAMEQIAKRDPTKPFFLWLSHLRPHSPYDPPRDFWDMYAEADLPDVPIGDWAKPFDPDPGLPTTAWQGRLPDDTLRRMRVGYMGSITHIDYQLGRLMEWMRREARVLDDTLILFTADHGDMQGDHNLLRKCQPYEGSARIPMLVRYPEGIDLPAGVFDQPVGLQDVMPTILEACGVDVPDTVTGDSLFRAVRGDDWRPFIHGEHSPCYALEQANHYLTDGREKYIWFPVGDREQLFDLAADRRELHDLSGDPAKRDRLELWRRRLIDHLADRGDGFSDGETLIPRTDRWGPGAE